MAYFPMFVNLDEKMCLVVGGGEVALRKIKVLMDFGARVMVIAPELDSRIKALKEQKDGKVQIAERGYEQKDCIGMQIVVAATDDMELNHRIAEFCKERGIMVNVVDQKEDCGFLFPAYVKEQNLVAAFSSGGNSPFLTQELKKKEKEILTPFLGQINESLGEWRSYIQSKIDDPEKRKEFYTQLYEKTMALGRIPSREEIQEMVGSYGL